MATRRSRGDGGLYWDESRQRWTAEVTVGFRPNGKRIVRKARGKTKSEAKTKLKELLSDVEEGAVNASAGYTVAQAVNDWLDSYGRGERDPNTVKAVRSLANNHIIPAIGARPLVKLDVDDVEEWLAEKAEVLVTSTLRNLRSILRRAINRAQVRKRVRHNVVLLCEELPAGKGTGRPSKALTLAQAEAVLTAAESSPMRAYIVVSLLTGARTEEMRPLTWDHVDLVGKPDASPAIPPNVKVWRSVRAKGETKTRKSRRTLALPERAVRALEDHWVAQQAVKAVAGDDWREQGLVFATNVGTERDVNNVRRDFRRVIKAAGLKPTQWTPRELRHSFVSILSDGGMPIEEISRLVGHSSTAVTELVYRKQIRPVVESGAVAMDRLFPATGAAAEVSSPTNQAS
ncbi:site-specific integrase [Amycolatopsis sp. NBRC 101858]|uniref:tyrosine-type recombinase/integrase n=1 Tax=Amycolatopsis sp. NBRC 101858 TaxID=3032200 RepID=UPI0024A46E08|nr:tyrosine-type recombinase/integrase [Amycolatopsis sp. NBRC 101858]GLY35779.1 site-specific integrase [Amycolatopsis sp. NBRC 101858]